jgi:hypothetical protein
VSGKEKEIRIEEVWRGFYGFLWEIVPQGVEKMKTFFCWLKLFFLNFKRFA